MNTTAQHTFSLGQRGDVGAERRAVLHAAMGDALDVCARPDFGQPKPIRLIYANGHINEMGMMNPRELLRSIQARRERGPEPGDPIPTMPERIEKWWASVSRWETCWTVEGGWQ